MKGVVACRFVAHLVFMIGSIAPRASGVTATGKVAAAGGAGGAPRPRLGRLQMPAVQRNARIGITTGLAAGVNGAARGATRTTTGSAAGAGAAAWKRLTDDCGTGSHSDHDWAAARAQRHRREHDWDGCLCRRCGDAARSESRLGRAASAGAVSSAAAIRTTTGTAVCAGAAARGAIRATIGTAVCAGAATRRRDQGHAWVEQMDTYEGEWYECAQCGARQGYRTPQDEIPDDEKHGGGGGKIW